MRCNGLKAKKTTQHGPKRGVELRKRKASMIRKKGVRRSK